MIDMRDHTIIQLIEYATNYETRAVVISDGDTVVAVNVDPGQSVLSTETIIFVTDQPRMPDLTGWSIRTVNEFAYLTDLDLEMTGSGFAKKQSIDPGDPIESGRYLFVEFEKD